MAGHEQFLEYCRSMKPPYQCPIVNCGRVYKSLAGIHTHMTTYDHTNLPVTPSPSSVGHTPGTGRKKGQKRPASPILGLLIAGGEPEPLPVPFSTDMKNVEFELDGKLMKISVFDPIEMLSKEEYEASLPPAVEETPIPEAAKTPVSVKAPLKTPSHKTPKSRGTGGTTTERGCDVQRYTIEDKKSKGLPEASFTIISDYYDNLPDAPPQTDEYFKFVEKSHLELAAEVEYDLDEEDCAWLDLVNEQRESEDLEPVQLADLQLLMDRLEKESFFQAESSGRGDSGVAPIDEDAVCCICMDGECQNSNVILFCDMCNLAVHQECYGVPYIPEGQWLCRRCLQSPSRAVDCALCPNKGGAFKQTDDSRWAHVVCAMWIPEVCFANTVFLEPIDSIGNIPAARWKLTCYICKQRGVGACIQCNKANCYTAFHVTCAQQAALHMKIDAIRETSTVGTNVTVRKAAYCDMHTPHDADTGEECEAGGAAKRAAEAKAAWRQKMKKARKILAEKRSAAPMVALPTIPPDRIQELAGLVAGVSRMSQFMHRLLAFWTLKRQSRNGVPLLRRLTNAHSSRRHASSSVGGANSSMGGASSGGGGANISLTELSPEKDGKSVGPPADAQKHDEEDDEESQANKRKDPTGKKKDGGGPKKKRKLLGAIDANSGGTSRAPSRPASPFDDMAALISQIKYWQTLRQDLEKARLLCELISKREREKKKMINVCSELRMVQLSPMVSLQLHVLQQLQDRDTNQIFAEPVNAEEVEDYSDVVTDPMDLSTMRQKATDHQYCDIDALEKDFELMIDNCLAYNAKDTIFYKAALKFRDQGGSILSQARRSVAITGFDPDTGLLLPHRPPPPQTLADAAIVTKVDGYLKTLGEGKLGEEAELRRLLDLAYQIGYHITRIPRIKSIRKELTKIKNSKEGNDEKTTATTDSTEDEDEEEEEEEDEGGEQTTKLPSADDDAVDDTAKASSDEKACPAASTSPRPSRSSSASTTKEAEPLSQSPSRGRRRASLSPAPRADEITVTPASVSSQPKTTGPATLFPSTASSSSTTTTSATPTTTNTTTTATADNEGRETPSGESTRGASRRGTRGRGRGAGRRGKGGTRRGDVKQKRIDSFFTKVSGPVTGDAQTNDENSNDVTSLKTTNSSKPDISTTSSSTACSNQKTSSTTTSYTTSTSDTTTTSSNQGHSDSVDAAPDEAAGELFIAAPFSDPNDDGNSALPAPTDAALATTAGRGGLRGGPRKRGRPFKRPIHAAQRTSDMAANVDFNPEESVDGPLTDPAAKRPSSESAADAKTVPTKPASVSGADNEDLSADGPPLPRYAPPSSEGLGLGFLDLGKDVSPPHLGRVAAPHKDSFKVYRTGGEQAPETDEETQSESTSSIGDSDSDSCSDSDSDGGGLQGGEGAGEQSTSGGQEIQLEPLDLVWAKCRGYPWYPALIINPKMPRTGYFHNRVPIPVPPLEVLELAHSCPLTHQYLVLFFDSKRTWQWLPRGKLEPLGERPALDKAKLVESRKPADRKAVKRAYEQAILHRCRVTGDSEGLTGDSEEELPQREGD